MLIFDRFIYIIYKQNTHPMDFKRAHNLSWGTWNSKKLCLDNRRGRGKEGFL